MPKPIKPAYIIIISIIFICATIYGLSDPKVEASGIHNSKPHILNLKINNRKPFKMDLYEITFTTDERFDNPYDPEQVEVIAGFTTPEKKREYINGFWYEGFSRSRRNGFEALTPDGTKAWKIRYTPRIPGEYRFYIELDNHLKSQNVRYPEKGYLNFTVSDSSQKGFIKASNKDKAYLEYDTGELFLGFGHNLCGWEWPGGYIDAAWNGTDNALGTYEYDEWLDKMHESNANLTQFDFGESDQIEWTNHPNEFPFSSDWRGLTGYNQQTAWKMDYRIKKAEEYGIYFRLTLLHWEDFDNEKDAGPNWGWNRNPYNSMNGGYAQTVSDFFTNRNAIKVFKKAARYINARWGYSGNLLAYELWNEVDSKDMAWGAGRTFQTESGNIANWHNEIASYLKSIDPYQHLITTSFTDSNNDISIWEQQNIDITTIHRYTYYNSLYGDKQYATVPTLLEIISRRFSEINKPVIVGEFALSPGGDIQRLYDKSGIEFHNQLWASVMAKGAATAMHWNWDSYIHKHNLYYHYFPIKTFFNGLDIRNTISFNNFQDEFQVIQYIGLKTPDKAYIWVRDRKNNFIDVKNGYIPAKISGQTIRVVLSNGHYRIDFYNTYNGQIIKTDYRDCSGGKLKVNLPDFIKDIAVKVEK